MLQVPLFKEDHISQLPPLQLLIKLGYKRLAPQEALEAQSDRISNVLLQTIFKKNYFNFNFSLSY